MRENLTLTLTPRAVERMKRIGGEFEVYIGQVGGGCHAQQAALVKSGTPAAELQDGYSRMEQDGIVVWVPDSIEFDEDSVEIDLQGILFMVILIATSAIVGQASVDCGTCGGCGGGLNGY